MLRLVHLLTLSSALLALGACAYNQPDQGATKQAQLESAFQQGANLTDAHSDEINAESASQRSDWVLTAAFSERSYRQKPDVVNEFNLATGYQLTGRNALAIPLYIDLVERGQFTPTVAILQADGHWSAHTMQPTISLESAARLQKMQVDRNLQTTIAAASTRIIE